MSAVDTAFHGLRHMIASGRLVAGQRFPAESELCDELGVSRGSLREAVRMLAALGIIESRHGSGTYVSMLRPEEIIGSLSLTVDLLPLDGLLQMYELRRVLETHAASQAAARASDEVHAELIALIEAMERTTDPSESSELDHHFHELIARTAGNATLTALLQVFRSRSRAYDVFSLPDGDDLRRISNRGHRSMTEAIISRDPVGAAGAASAHVAQTEEWLRVLQPPASPTD